MSTVECGLTGKLCREILSLGPSGKTFDRSRRYPSSENQNKRRRNAGIQQWSSANGVTGAKAVPLRLTFLSESQSSVLFVAIKETFLDALTVSWHNRYEVNEYRNNRSNSDGLQEENDHNRLKWSKSIFPVYRTVKISATMKFGCDHPVFRHGVHAKPTLYTRITRIPCRSNGLRTSGVAPASVISMWISLLGQIKAGPTLSSLLESATTITCFDCLSILR